MLINIKRTLLLLLAIIAVVLAVGPAWSSGPFQLLRAYQSSPVGTPTFTPTPTITPSPTFTPIGGAPPTPTRSRKVVNEITHPGTGDAVAGSVIVRGTALLPAYRRYDVHLSLTGAEEWRWLATNYDVVRDGILYIWETTEVDDGYYDLRIRAVDDQGEYTESFARALQVRNANPPTPTRVINLAGTPLAVSPLATPTPTVTPTPPSETRVQGGQGFYGPESGDMLRGYVPIFGTVNGWWENPFVRYELAVSATGEEDWQWLYSGEEQFWQDQIYVLDTTQFEDGFYDLRLRIVYQDGNYDEYYLRALRLVNARPSVRANVPRVQANGFTRPAPGSAVGGVVTFRGTAVDRALLRWELYWSPAGEEQWSYLTSSERPVIEDELAVLDLSQLPEGQYDFLLRIVRSDYNYEDYTLHNLTIHEPTPTAPATPDEPTPTPTSTPAG